MISSILFLCPRCSVLFCWFLSSWILFLWIFFLHLFLLFIVFHQIHFGKTWQIFRNWESNWANFWCFVLFIIDIWLYMFLMAFSNWRRKFNRRIKFFFFYLFLLSLFLLFFCLLSWSSLFLFVFIFVFVFVFVFIFWSLSRFLFFFRIRLFSLFLFSFYFWGISLRNCLIFWNSHLWFYSGFIVFTHSMT